MGLYNSIRKLGLRDKAAIVYGYYRMPVWKSRFSPRYSRISQLEARPAHSRFPRSPAPRSPLPRRPEQDDHTVAGQVAKPIGPQYTSCSEFFLQIAR